MRQNQAKNTENTEVLTQMRIVQKHTHSVNTRG